jgi:SSS family solute:Na+ symporter
VTAGVVVSYTLFGGFLAVSLTDFVQGVIMFIALVLVPIVAFTSLGGVGTTFDEVRAIDPSFLNLFAGTSVLGIISLLAWGLGYFGQPHIIVRFMAIKSVRDFKAARRIGMSWMIVSIIGAMATGLVGIAYVSRTGLDLANQETIFIALSQVLFHPFIGGFLLAAILAAIMSTISSQLLVTSSALTEDFYKTFFRREASDKELVLAGRISVLIVAIVGVFLSYTPNDTILNLVGNAWAGFGAAFGPVIILSLYWKRMNRWGALAGMLVGSLTVLFWIYTPIEINGETLSSIMYEMVPGFILSTIAVIVVSYLTNFPRKTVRETFTEMEETLEEEQNK